MMLVKKIWAIVRWLLVTLVWALISFGTVWYMFPLAWLLKGLGKWNPFWLWMDDSRINNLRKSGYASDYETWLRRRHATKENFKLAYKWHTGRNRMWNFIELFTVKDGDPVRGNQRIELISYWSDKLFRWNDPVGMTVPQNAGWVTMAGLKYHGHPDDDPWQVNSGEIINSQTSVFGKGGMWYRVGNWVSFRYSHCIKFLGYWWTLRIGTNSNRYVFTIKFQKQVKII